MANQVFDNLNAGQTVAKYPFKVIFHCAPFIVFCFHFFTVVLCFVFALNEDLISCLLKGIF